MSETVNKKGQQDRNAILLHKDDVVTVSIEDIGSDGAGIGRVNGFTLFVKDSVPGDTVIAKVMKVKKGYGFARLMQVAEPSPFRVAPKCPIARRCGGCQLQELSYGQQLLFKTKKVRDVLIRIGGFCPEQVDSILQPIIGMEDPWRFRNKEQLPIGMQNGKPAAGFYAGRTHCIVPVSDCLVGAAENQWIMKTVLQYMEDFQVSAYDEETGKGLLRHVLIRGGKYTGEIMVCLVINGTRLPDEGELVRRLRALLPAGEAKDRRGAVTAAGEARNRHGAVSAAEETKNRQGAVESFEKWKGTEPGSMTGSGGITSISVNTNTARTNVIMGEKTRTLWGSDSITDVMHVMDVEYTENAEDVEKIVFHSAGRQVSFRISPLSFYQVNPVQAERLYSLVRHYAGLTGKETVWDLYCGVGTIGCFLAADAGEVYGVEVIPDAIRDAGKNAAGNGITNISFHVGKVEEVVPAYVERRLQEMSEQTKASGKSLVDVVVVDPPRKGCDEKCLQTILKVKPERIVYVSCDPATMARDCRILAAGGYELKAVQPVDQFPHTIHVETVVLLQKRK